MGDSITYGYEATDEDRRFVSVLTGKLNARTPTYPYVHARPGWRAEQLLAGFPRIPEAILREADLVTLLVGGNDLLRAMPWYLDSPEGGRQRLVQTFCPAFRDILRAVARKDTCVLVSTLYNPFPGWDVAADAVGGLNALIADMAVEQNCGLVRLDKWYGGRETRYVKGYKRGEAGDFRLVRNPIHPNDEGHARIADALYDAFECWRKARRETGRTRRPLPRAQTGAAAGARDARAGLSRRGGRGPGSRTGNARVADGGRSVR